MKFLELTLLFFVRNRYNLEAEKSPVECKESHMQREVVIREPAGMDVAEDLDQKIAERVELRDLLERKGSNWSDGEGYARIIADSMRLSYQTKALDELIIKDPLHYGWLKDYRKESPVRGGVQVK
jgi:hypothetical protein